MRHIDFAGFQACENLTALYNLKVQLFNFGRTLKIVGVRCIGNIMLRVKVRYHIRSAYHIRVGKPLIRRKLCLTEFLDDMLRQNIHISRIPVFKADQ